MTGKIPTEGPFFLSVNYSKPFLKLVLITFLMVACMAGAAGLFLAGKFNPQPVLTMPDTKNVPDTVVTSIGNGEETITQLPQNLPAALADNDEPQVLQIDTTLGDTLFGNDYVITVDDLDHATSFSNYLSAGQDKTLLALHVAVESQSENGVEVNPQNWRLYDYYQPFEFVEVYAGKDPSLPTNKTLLNGERMQGWVTFEIPNEANRFKLVYEVPNISEKVSFIFDIGF